MIDQRKNEQVLWEKVKKGDTVALGKLYDTYIDNLFSYGIQVSGDKSYVMDCIHDLFFDIYKYRSKLAKTDNVEYYLIGSLRRKINKKYKSKEILFSEEFSQTNFQNIKSNSKSFEEGLIASELYNERIFKLSKALKFLSKKQKQGLFLRFNEEKPYEEIASIMNVTVQSSRTLIYRAIKELRKQITTFLFTF